MPKQNMNNPYTVLRDGSLQMGQTIFLRWPDFSISGLPVDVPKRLHHLLTSLEPIPYQWREGIPADVLQSLRKFEDKLLPDLLTVAQTDPLKFVDWANFCPALIVLALHASRSGKEVDEEKIYRLMHCGWRTVLVETGWSPKKSTLRILQRVSPKCLNLLQLGMLRAHLRNSQKLRIIRHLKRIDSAVIDTLHLAPEVLSVRLLEISSSRSELINAESMRALCDEIIQFRRETKRLPVWPFRHGQLSEETLYHAEQLIMMHRSMQSLSSEIRFPRAPFLPFKSSKFEARPISTPRELYQEGISMRNCLPGYAAQVASGSHFAYRILKPERATLLILKSEIGWIPSQLKTIANGNPEPLTFKFVEAWLGQQFSREEVQDAPF